LRAKLPAKFVSYVVKADSGFGMTPPCSQGPLLAQKSLIQRPELPSSVYYAPIFISRMRFLLQSRFRRQICKLAAAKLVEYEHVEEEDQTQGEHYDAQSLAQVSNHGTYVTDVHFSLHQRQDDAEVDKAKSDQEHVVD
jgi:hypothetical protein